MKVNYWNDNCYGSRMKVARLRLGMGQLELARELGTNQSTISRIEKGTIPRKKISNQIVEFIKLGEQKSDERIDKIIGDITHSEELRALIGRVIAEI